MLPWWHEQLILKLASRGACHWHDTPRPTKGALARAAVGFETKRRQRCAAEHCGLSSLTYQHVAGYPLNRTRHFAHLVSHLVPLDKFSHFPRKKYRAGRSCNFFYWFLSERVRFFLGFFLASTCWMYVSQGVSVFADGGFCFGCLVIERNCWRVKLIIIFWFYLLPRVALISNGY